MWDPLADSWRPCVTCYENSNVNINIPSTVIFPVFSQIIYSAILFPENIFFFNSVQSLVITDTQKYICNISCIYTYILSIFIKNTGEYFLCRLNNNIVHKQSPTWQKNMCIQYGIYFSFIFLDFNERIFCIYLYHREKNCTIIERQICDFDV